MEEVEGEVEVPRMEGPNSMRMGFSPRCLRHQLVRRMMSSLRMACLRVCSASISTPVMAATSSVATHHLSANSSLTSHAMGSVMSEPQMRKAGSLPSYWPATMMSAHLCNRENRETASARGQKRHVCAA